MKGVAFQAADDPLLGKGDALLLELFFQADGDDTGAEVAAPRAALEEVLSVEYGQSNVEPFLPGDPRGKMGEKGTGGPSADDGDPGPRSETEIRVHRAIILLTLQIL